MAESPVDKKAEAPKAVDVLAAAAGVPTPAQAKGLWTLVRRHRKLALLLGGFGMATAAAGYGYKYFTAIPGKVNAQADPPAVAARPEEPKPSDEQSVIKLPALPDMKAPTVSDINLPDINLPDVKAPDIKPPDTTDTTPPPISPLGPAEKPKKPTIDDLPDIAPPIPGIEPPDTDKKKPAAEVKTPPLPTITLPSEKKKPAPEGEDPFKATGTVPTDAKLGPAPLPADVTDEKPDAPVLRVEGTDPKVVPAPMPVKKDEPAVPMIPKIDDLPPPPGADKKKDDVPIVPPSPGKDDDIPTIKVPGPKPDVPPVVVSPTTDNAPEVPPLPGNDPPVKPPLADPPTIPPIDIKAGPPPAAPVRKDNYDDTWHEDHGEPYAAISREYYHDPKYAAALEAYNKGRRDKIIRVPPPWVLEEKFPDLVGKDKAPAEPKPTGNGGLKFEPVAPLPASGRPAPASATSRPTDEYRVTAEAGETIREVARKALGDAGAWKKLYDLNPNIDPTLPLPAGTILRLK
jgi:hypothetical protein